MLKELIKLANHLDSRGFVKEADQLDGIIVKLAQDWAPARRALREALDEYSALAADGFLNLYWGLDKEVADEVVQKVRLGYSESTTSTVKTNYEGDRRWAGPALDLGPSELIQMATDIEQKHDQNNKPMFKIIMTELGTTHMSGLNNMSARRKWDAFVREHNDRMEQKRNYVSIQERMESEPWVVRQRERERAWNACDQQPEIMKLYKRYLDAQIGSGHMSDEAKRDLESGLYGPPGVSPGPMDEAHGLPNWSASDWPPASLDELRAAEKAYIEAVEDCIASKARAEEEQAEEEQREWDEGNPPIWEDVE